MRILKWALTSTVFALLIGLLAIKVIYGGGTPYPDVSTAPRYDTATAEITLPLPPGMVAVGPQGRMFYTYHPFHRPQDHADHLVFEWRDGVGHPIAPNLADRLTGVFGITVDAQGNVWAVRPGAMEGRPTEVLAINPDNGELVFEFTFPKGEAGFAQDLRVSSDGNTVYLADTGLLRFTSTSLIVLDVPTRSSRVVLENHPTTAPQNLVMRRTDGSPYRLGFGLVTFQVGVDGLEISEDGNWLIYAAMTHDGVFRVPTDLLRDPNVSDAHLDQAIERLGVAPMSDGIALTAAGEVVLTDVENGGLALLDAEGALTTLVSMERVDWADSVSIAPNGDIWFTDSRLTALLDQLGEPASFAEMQADGPFHIYRIPAPKN